MILLGVLSDITKFHIQLFFMPWDGSLCVYVWWEIYSHICSSVHQHKWHAHSWEVASCSRILYRIHSWVPSGLGAGASVGPRIGIMMFLSFPTLWVWEQVTCHAGSHTHTCEPLSKHDSLNTSTQTCTHKSVRILSLASGRPWCFHVPGEITSVGFFFAFWLLHWVYSMLLL